MATLVSAYQLILVQNVWPDWLSLLPVVALAAFLCLFGMRLFRQRTGEMVDEL